MRLLQTWPTTSVQCSGGSMGTVVAVVAVAGSGASEEGPSIGSGCPDFGSVADMGRFNGRLGDEKKPPYGVVREPFNRVAPHNPPLLPTPIAQSAGLIPTSQ